MSTALRLNDELVREAEAEALVAKRTTPKQIEYWAEIGRSIVQQVSPGDLLVLTQGFAEVKIEPIPSAAVDPNEVFSEVEKKRANGTLRQSVCHGQAWYEASEASPGLLEKIYPDGRRETGNFQNGTFIPAS